jgi:guanylate kinase
MDSYEDFDYEITNDTLEKLKEDVYKIYQEETK